MIHERIYIVSILLLGMIGCDSTTESSVVDEPSPVEVSSVDPASNPNPMFEALELEDIEQLETLYISGHPIDSLDFDGRTLLRYAVTGQSRAVVTWLLERGADPGGQPDLGQPPLPLAIEFVSIDGGDTAEAFVIIELLIQHGADPMEHGNGYASAIQHAMDLGCESCISLMKELSMSRAAELAQSRQMK